MQVKTRLVYESLVGHFEFDGTSVQSTDLVPLVMPVLLLVCPSAHSLCINRIISSGIGDHDQHQEFSEGDA